MCHLATSSVGVVLMSLKFKPHSTRPARSTLDLKMHKFNLIENANDSHLEHPAIKHMGPIDQNSIGDWKRIIVDFSHVVELLFKEKLH